MLRYYHCDFLRASLRLFKINTVSKMIQKTKNNRSTIRFSTLNDIFTDTNLIANDFVCVLCLFSVLLKEVLVVFLVMTRFKIRVLLHRKFAATEPEN